MYPVGFDVDFVERRSRLSTFFRWLLVIPWGIVAIFYGIGAGIAALIAWFAIVFTARYPRGLYDFNVGYTRFYGRVNGWANLLVDPFPAWGGGEDEGYPIRIPIDPPLESYSRLKTGFRFILLIPVQIVMYVMQVIVGVLGFLSWIVIVITGKQIRGMHDLLRLGLAYYTRATAYSLLITEAFPPLSDGGAPEVAAPPPAAGGGAPPPPPPA